ncbi:LacI family DNA-binding transcriptional regulator, partial [Vibrio diabolicus]
LTSVELPYSDMGKLAIESLMALIEGQPLLSNKRKVEGELIVRTSSTKTKKVGM